MPRSLTPDTIRTFLSRLTSSTNSTPNASSDHLNANPNLESIKQKSSRVSPPTSRSSLDVIRSAFKRNSAQQQSPNAPVLRLQLPPDSSSPLSTVANTPKASLDVPRPSRPPDRTSLEDSGEMPPARPTRPPPPIPRSVAPPPAPPPISVSTTTLTPAAAKQTAATPSSSPISTRPPSLRLTPSLVLRPPLPIRNLPALPPIITSTADHDSPSHESAGAGHPASAVRLSSMPALMHDGERDEGWDGDGDPDDEGELGEGDAEAEMEDTETGESGDSPRGSEHSDEESVYFDANHGAQSARPSPTTSSFVRPPAPGFAQAIARRASSSSASPTDATFTAPSIPIPRRESLGFAFPTPTHSRFSTVSSSAGNRESVYFTPRQSWALPSSTSTPRASWIFPNPSPAPQADEVPRRGTITRLPSVDDTPEPAADEILSESLGLSLTPPAAGSLTEKPSGITTPAALVPTPMSWVYVPGSNATPGPGPATIENAAAASAASTHLAALGTESPTMRRRSKAPDYFSLFPMHAHQNSVRTPRPSDFTAGLSPSGGSCRPNLFHQASKSMVDLSAFSPPSTSHDISASPSAPSQPLMTPPLHRRLSMPELPIPPPPYPRGPPPREDEGCEQLPPYSNAIKLSGYMPRKMEYSAPGVLARDRSWRKVYCVLEGTVFRVYKVSTLESVFGGSRLASHAKSKTGSSLGSLKEVVAAGASAAAVATGAGRYGLQQTPSRASTSGSSAGSSPSTSTTSASASTAASSTLSIPVPRPSTPPTDLDTKLSPAVSSSTSSPRRSSSSRRSSSPVRTSTSSHRSSFNLSSRPTLTASSTPEKAYVPPPGSLLHAYTLQNAESGLGTDYLKRQNVIRVRMEGQQFLLQASNLMETVEWIEGFQAAAGIALDLDERPMPKGAQFPRRRRRRRPRPSETAATGENATTNNNATAATTATTNASAS